MTNIRAVSIDVTYDFNFNDYARAMEDIMFTEPDEEGWLTQRKQEAIASRFGGAFVPRKIPGQPDEVELHTTSPILPLLFSKTEQENLSAIKIRDIGDKISTNVFDNDDRINKLSDGANISKRIFSEYMKDPVLSNKLYENNSLISFETIINGRSSLMFVRIPKSKFTPTYFTAVKKGNAVEIVAKAKLQKDVMSLAAQAEQKAIINAKPLKKKVKIGKATGTIEYFPKDMVRGKHVTKITHLSGLTYMHNKKPKSVNQFISSAQITALVREKLSASMPMASQDPSPPDMRYITGRFANTVQVNVNYRTQMMKYFYYPLYDANRVYGYRPAAQVEDSIRAVAQTLFTQAFESKFIYKKGF